MDGFKLDVSGQINIPGANRVSFQSREREVDDG